MTKVVSLRNRLIAVLVKEPVWNGIAHMRADDIADGLITAIPELQVDDVLPVVKCSGCDNEIVIPDVQRLRDKLDEYDQDLYYGAIIRKRLEGEIETLNQSVEHWRLNYHEAMLEAERTENEAREALEAAQALEHLRNFLNGRRD